MKHCNSKRIKIRRQRQAAIRCVLAVLTLTFTYKSIAHAAETLADNMIEPLTIETYDVTLEPIPAAANPYDQIEVRTLDIIDTGFEDPVKVLFPTSAGVAVMLDDPYIAESVLDDPLSPDETIINAVPESEINDMPDNTNNVVLYNDHITASGGTFKGPSGRETWYDLPMGGVIRIMRKKGFSEEEYPYWVREDGAKMFGSYIIVAANLETRPKGTVLDTSLGPAIVCDTGEFVTTHPDGIDIAVDWKDWNGR